MLHRLIGVSPSRHPPELSPLPATLSTLGLWLDRSIIIPIYRLCRKGATLFITWAVLARIPAFKKEGMKRRFCYRLGVPVMWLGYIGTYPLCLYAVCRYLAYCPFSKYIDYYQPIQRYLTENAFGWNDNHTSAESSRSRSPP